MMPVQSHARLPVPFEMSRAWLLAAPVWQDRGRIEADGSLHVTFGVGTMRLMPATGKAADSALLLECEDEAGLQVLRDFITEEVEEVGVTPLWQEHYRVGRPANLCVATLERVEQISPAFRRLWLRGADLARLMQGGLHFRLLLGPAGAGWPRVDEHGLTQWPGGGAAAWHRPVYTVRHIEGAGAETRIAVDIFLHDGGRVTAWSESLQPGQEVGLMGPSGGDIPEGSGGTAPWFGLYGDETALPAMARILAGLPENARGVAVLRVPQPADRQELTHPAGITLRWLLRDGGEGEGQGGDAGADGQTARSVESGEDRTSSAETLLDALRATDLPAADRFVFFAAGSAETAAARDLLAGRGLGKKDFWAQAYWQEPGKSG